MNSLLNKLMDVDRQGRRDAAQRPELTGGTSRLGGAAGRSWRLVAVLSMLVGGAGQAHAGVILTMNAATTINGATPSGTMSATIADNPDGTVRITLLNNLTDPDEFVTTWGFGLRSTFTDYSGLTFTKVSTSPKAGSPPMTPGPTFADSAVASANTGFNPSSVGDFNVRFDWDGNNHTFSAGTSVVYDLKYNSTSNTPQSFGAILFDATNHNPGNNIGLVYTAVKIQGIDKGPGSGELGDRDAPFITIIPSVVGVPEPSMFAMAACMLPMGLIVWRKQRKQASAA